MYRFVWYHTSVICTDLYGIIPPECIDLEMEFDMTMMPSLEDCSRQQLRLFHMNLLKYGANVHERVSSKDLLTAFQVSTIRHTFTSGTSNKNEMVCIANLCLAAYID